MSIQEGLRTPNLFNQAARTSDWRPSTLEDAKTAHHLLAKDLPNPSNSLAIVTTIAAYDELRNGNFFLFLQSYLRQIQESGKKHEVLYIVNNSQNEAEAKSAQYQDNQNLLKVLSALNQAIQTNLSPEDLQDFFVTKLADINLTPWEMKVLSSAVERKAAIYGVDLSSNNTAVDFVLGHQERESKKGTALNIGSMIAYMRLQKSQNSIDECYVDFLDADCMLPLNYYRNLIDESCAPYVAKPLRASFYEIGELVREEKDKYKQLARMIAQMRQTLFERYLYLNSVNDNSGPTQCIRADLLLHIGFYPYAFARNEDFKFASLVKANNISPTQALTRTRVKLSHRSRMGSHDGKNAGCLYDHENLSGIKSLSATINDLTPQYEVQKVLRENIELETKLDQTQLANYRKIRYRFFREEVLLKIVFIKDFKNILRGFLENPKADQEPVQSYINRLFREKIIESYMHNFLSHNSTFITLFETLKSVVKDVGCESLFESLSLTNCDDDFDKIMRFLTFCLPEYFSPPLETEPNYNQTLLTLESTQQHVNSGDFVHLASALRHFNYE